MAETTPRPAPATQPAPQMESRLARQDPAIAKIPRHWAALKLAHEALMLDDAQAVLAEDRRATRAHRDQMGARSSPPSSALEDGMGIHVGDQIVHQAAPAPPPAGISKLVALALAAASLLGGGGLGLGIASLLRSAPAAAPVNAPAGPQSRDLRVKWWIEHGKIKTAVEPVQPVDKEAPQ